MWFRTSSTNFVDLTSGHSLSVRPYDDSRMVRTYQVVSYMPKPGLERVVLGEGYKSEDEAVAALDDFISSHGIQAPLLQPPVTEEEIAEER